MNCTEIQELDKKGFARSSYKLLRYIRKNKMVDIKFFKVGANSLSGSKGDAKYSAVDIFGDHFTYYFYISRKKEFVNFLVDKFLMQNKDPDKNLRKVFTKILHSHGLHWEECWCANKS